MVNDERDIIFFHLIFIIAVCWAIFGHRNYTFPITKTHPAVASAVYQPSVCPIHNNSIVWLTFHIVRRYCYETEKLRTIICFIARFGKTGLQQRSTIANNNQDNQHNPLDILNKANTDVDNVYTALVRA